MPQSKVPDTVARPVRGAAQGATSYIVVEFVDSFLYDMNDKQYGAAVALLAILFSFIQVVVENYMGKAVLRTIPEPDAKVIDEGGKHL